MGKQNTKNAVPDARGSFHNIIGKNERMQKVYDLIETVGPTLTTVYITGETGTGKELVARAIHDCSKRSFNSFLKVDCTALPDTLLESELFGYKRGAFTDARFNKPGKFELADRGTIFLDEIGEIPLPVQAKLLRVLEDQAFEPLGATRTVRVDIRIIIASNRDLKKEVKRETFRKDLYYRLNAFPIELPKLSERRDDIPSLVDHFLGRVKTGSCGKISGVSPEVMDLLMDLPWPGNIRQLKHAIEYAAINCQEGMIKITHLPRELLNNTADENELSINEPGSINEIDKNIVIETLKRNRLKISKTAVELGISRTTLWRKMHKYHL
jgi:transcriptional regulator with PAS, ATPase and Fis domain